MPILSILANALSNFHQYICKSTKLPLYGQSSKFLIFSSLVQLEKKFPYLFSQELIKMSNPVVNKIFFEFLRLNFDNFIVVNTDGLVSSISVGFSFYIPELHIFFTNNLPPSS